MAHLEFDFGCVSDAHKNEYLYEEGKFLISYFGFHGFELCQNVLRITHENFWPISTVDSI